MRTALVVTLTLIAFAGCGPEEETGGPLMQPGVDCMSCHAHTEGSSAWSVAGTVYAKNSTTTPSNGASIEITDANGLHVSLTSNTAGNFYSRTALAFPLASVSVKNNGTAVAMVASVSNGSCNSCHSQDGAAHARLQSP
jgi:hypothetical protein